MKDKWGSICGWHECRKSARAIKEIIGVQLQSAGYYPNLNLKQLLELFAGLYNISIDPMKLLADVNLVDKAKINLKN